MIFNYIRIACRHLLRNKGYTGLTLFGLAVGIASFLLIGLWAGDELGYDRFHSQGERIYRALWDAKVGDNEWRIPLIPVPVADALQKFPEVERTVRFARAGRGIRHQGMVLREDDFFYTEPDFFRIFTVRTVAGDPAAALSSHDNVVLTSEAARKYFGNGDVLGRSLELSDGSVLRVEAVVEPFPGQSHFRFEMLASIEKYPAFQYRRTNWGSATVYTYFLLKEGASAAELDRKMREYVEGTVLRDEELFRGGANRSGFPFQRMLDIHLHSDLEYELSPGGDIKTVGLLAGVGVIILLLACVNFINLSTARASQRAHEVGVRKTLGSNRVQLLLQFFTESGIIVSGATGLALLVIELSLPHLNDLSGKHLALRYADAGTVLMGVGIAAVVTLIAGIYPALVLSSFAPVRVLKGLSTDGRGRTAFRNVLVVFQFAICIGLMIAMTAMYGQLRYMLGRDLGFDREHVLVLRGAPALDTKMEAFLHELESSPHITAAAPVQTLPGYGFDSQLFEPEQPSNYQQTSLAYAMVDSRFADVLRLRLSEGRNFSPKMPTDSSAFLINQSAATALGWERPLGKKLKMGNFEGPVIGVVEDFNFESLRSEIKPIVFPFLRWTPGFIAIRLQSGDIEGHIAFLESTWKKFLPDRPPEYSFLDEDYRRLYRSESKLSDVFTLFTGIALVIACLGLFGLASYTVERRVKEIGIRKVLGASVAGIVGLLSGQFLRLVFISCIVASPIAYFAVNGWLGGFAYRISLGPTTFIAVGLTAMALALLTIGFQAVRAARANPVESLRYE